MAGPIHSIPDDDNWWDDVAAPITPEFIAKTDTGVQYAYAMYISDTNAIDRVRTVRRTVMINGVKNTETYYIIGFGAPVLMWAVNRVHPDGIDVDFTIYAGALTWRQIKELCNDVKYATHFCTRVYTEKHNEIERRNVANGFPARED